VAGRPHSYTGAGWCQIPDRRGGLHLASAGNENYFVSGDGYLMPAREDQAPPDMRCFKPVQK
jgi:hypothetical protein